MLDKNHKNNSNCEFAAEAMSYLYGESAAREKIEFEAHLNSCSRCADELAGFGLVRSSIFEWKSDFSALETPAFNLPTEKARNFIETVSAQKTSWLDGLYDLFSLPQSRAVAAFAALIIFVGLTIFAFNYSGNSGGIEVAESEVNKNAVPTASATIEKKIKQSIESASAEENFSDKSLEPREEKVEKAPRITVETTQANNNAAKEPIVKVSANPRKTKVDDKSSQNSNNSSGKEIYKENKKPLPAQAQKVPKLVEDDDAEDDSVRLTDLFDEIDTK